MLHSSGHFAEAVQACRQILKCEPENPEALHLCGRACLDDGHAPEAVPLLEKAASLQPSSPIWRFDFGLALQAAGRFADAARAYRHSLALKPANADGWCRLASVLRKTQEWEESAKAYRKAIEYDSSSEEAIFGLGNVLLEQRKWKEAAEKFRQTLTLQPRHPEAHNGLGLALKGANQLKEAVTAFREALAQRPRYLEALFNLGTTLQTQEKWPEAIATFQQAVAIAPHSSETLSNLGNALWGARDFAGALVAHQQALQFRPEHAATYNNIGNALLGLHRFEKAAAAFGKSLELLPNNASTLCNLGNVHLAQNQLDQAFALYERSLEADPSFKQGIFNKSLVHLLRGEFSQGLPGYELRWILRQQSFSGEVPKEQWRGDAPLEGKTILVCCEQGFGDTFQFVRYVPLLQQRGAKVILRVQTALKDMLACLPGVTLTSADDTTLPAFDYYCLMLSLPLAFGTELATIPANIPYLASPPEITAIWRERMARLEGPKVGIVCSGNTAHRNDYNRSIPLSAFKPLAASTGGNLFLIQKDVRPHDEIVLLRLPEIISLASEIKDFTDTAAIIANLDLVISVDTSVVHLAGALGKPVWTLLPFAPDWRWMVDRPDSPWYSTMRLFRQPSTGAWAPVLEQVKSELDKFVQGLNGSCSQRS